LVAIFFFAAFDDEASTLSTPRRAQSRFGFHDRAVFVRSMMPSALQRARALCA
jgi:hypothetical protein